MQTERIVGLLFFLGILTLFMFMYFPESSSKKDNINSDKLISLSSNKEVKIINGFKEFEESDFDFFVYRAHILSSKVNANNLKDNINNGGFPAFIETYGDSII